VLVVATGLPHIGGTAPVLVVATGLPHIGGTALVLVVDTGLPHIESTAPVAASTYRQVPATYRTHGSSVSGGYWPVTYIELLQC